MMAVKGGGQLPIVRLTSAYTCFCPEDQKSQCELPDEIYELLYLPNTFAFDIDENLSMVMQVLEEGRDSCQVKNKADYKGFSKKFQMLSVEEVVGALTLSEQDFLNQLSASVPCVGCRKSAEKLYQYSKSASHVHTFYPFSMSEEGFLQICEDKRDRNEVYKILYNQSGSMKELIKWFQKFSNFDKAKRCNYHSSELQKGVKIVAAWIDIWNYMSPISREKASFVQEETMQRFLDDYLKKNRFCTDCRKKVLRAYDLLLGKLDGTNEPGYIDQMYDGITYDPKTRVIQIEPSESLIKYLMGRAVPELSAGNERERHAKTMDTAQEEVLTCIGVSFIHRLSQIQQRFRVEERAFQLVMCIVTSACRKQFEIAVDQKSGVGGLSWCDAMDKEAEAKRQKKALKKKKQRKSKKQGSTPGDELDIEEYKENLEVENENTQTLDKTVTQPLQVDVMNKGFKKPKLLPGNISPNENSQDCGYSSGNNVEHLSGKTTPYGSDTSCSEGFCNRKVCEEPVKKEELNPDFKENATPSDFKQFFEKTLRGLKADYNEDEILVPNELKNLVGSKHWVEWREANQKMLKDNWKEWLEKNVTPIPVVPVVNKSKKNESSVKKTIPKKQSKKPKVHKRTCRDSRRYKGKNRY